MNSLVHGNGLVVAHMRSPPSRESVLIQMTEKQPLHHVPFGTVLALVALAMGGFGIGTGEFAIMGLLPDVAGEFSISPPQAGYAISAYALGVVLGAPLLAVFFARVPRKIMLMGLMAAFALGNLASAMAPNFLWLVVFRFIAGLPHGAYFGIAGLVAAQIVAPEKRAQAIGRMMLGISLSNVLGVPLVTWFGQLASWRAAFGFVGMVGVATIGLLFFFAPKIAVADGASPLRELGALARKQVWLTLAVGSIGFGGMFAVYSYIAPTLIHAAGASPATVPLVMSLFGVGMILGSIAGGWMADRALHATIWALLLWNVVVLGSFTFLGHSLTGATLVTFLMGCGVAIVPAMQMRLMEVAHHAQTLASSLNHSALNIGNALGAWLGGLSIAAGYGWTSTGWVGASLAIGGMLVFAVSMALDALDRRKLAECSP